MHKACSNAKFKVQVLGGGWLAVGGCQWAVGSGWPQLFMRILWRKKYENTSRTGRDGSEWRRSLMNNSVHRLLTRPGVLKLLSRILRPSPWPHLTTLTPAFGFLHTNHFASRKWSNSRLPRPCGRMAGWMGGRMGGRNGNTLSLSHQSADWCEYLTDVLKEMNVWEYILMWLATQSCQMATKFSSPKEHLQFVEFQFPSPESWTVSLPNCCWPLAWHISWPLLLGLQCRALPWHFTN